MPDEVHANLQVMPCGGHFWLDRPRSDGPLSGLELAYCLQSDIPLAFDPIQSGWVSAMVEDDLAVNEIVDKTKPRMPHLQPGAKPAMHLGLRAWAQSDLARYVMLLDDPDVWANMPEAYPNPVTPDMASALIELSNASNHHQVHAVLHDDQPIGQVRLEFDCDDTDPGVAEVSYWFGRAYWGQGLASVAVAAFARQSLAENPGLSKLVAKVKNGNPASRRVLEKAGFVLADNNTLPGWQWLYRMR